MSPGSSIPLPPADHLLPPADHRLPPADHPGRVAATAAALARDGIDGLWVTAAANVRYLTGFSGSAGVVLVTGDGAILATDDRYDERAAAEAPTATRVITRDPLGALLERADGVLGFERDHISWSSGEALTDRAAEHGIEVTPTSAVVERLRTVKDAHELAVLRAACAITDAAYAALLPTLAAGQSERDVAVRLERLLVDLGAETPAFDAIVACGPNSAVPHHRPTDRRLTAGDLLKLDFGARYAGYHADMTRTVAIGPPDPSLRRIHDIVRTAQAAGTTAAIAGRSSREVDAACRDHIAAEGFGEAFLHGTGHGIGLDIHEAPAVAQQARATLTADMTLTVEPGIYLPGRGGVRIEDSIAIRPDGQPEFLTASARELVVL